MIELQDVSKTWPDGTRALSDVRLRVPRGQFCVVLGPSGAGKSTLLRSINGLVTPTSGRVLIDGVELNSRTQRQLRRRVAMIHQHFNLTLRMSAAANVLAGLLPAVSTPRALTGWFTSAHRRKACALLERVGLDPLHLHRRAGDLSGGQQQRVGIARALVLDPEVVLADEPVASLDPRISREILELIRSAARERNVTVLCSLHQVEYARAFADRVVGMREGRVMFDGVPGQLTDGHVREIYAVAPGDRPSHGGERADAVTAVPVAGQPLPA